MINFQALIYILIIISTNQYVKDVYGVTEYTIGALLSNNSVISEFKRAVEKENLKYVSKDIVFIPQAEEMNLKPLKAAQQVCNLIKTTKKRMFALIVSHPKNAPEIPPLSASFTCAFYNVPVVGISARQSAFSDKYSHSSFLRTVPPYSEEAWVWNDLIRQFKWKEVSLIYSDDQEGKTLLSRLERASDDHKHFKITRSVSFPSEDEELDGSGGEVPVNYTQLLDPIRLDQTRAMVLYARPQFAKKVLKAAAKMEMLGVGWAWIVTEQVLSMKELPTGIIGLKLSNSMESKHVKDAVSIVTKGIASMYQNNSSIMKVISAPSDCGVNPYGDDGSSWLTFGKRLYNKMKTVKLDDGATGKLSIDNKGDRVLPVYDIVNVQYVDKKRTSATKLVKVGTYGIKKTRPAYLDPKETFLELLELDMGKIYWPSNFTGTQKKEICVTKEMKDSGFLKNYKVTSIKSKEKPGNNAQKGSGQLGSKSQSSKSNVMSSDKLSGNKGIKSGKVDCEKVTIEMPVAPKSFMKKKVLKVVTKRSIPFVSAREVDGPGKEKCDWSPDPTVLKKEVPCSHTTPTGIKYYCCKGYCIDLLRRLANRTDIEDNFTPFDYDLHLVRDGEVGQKTANDSTEWTGMVGELVDGVADLAVAPMTITPERAARVEFTKPFKYLGLTILVKREESISNLGSFLQPFENTLWVLVALSVHVVALVLYLLDRFSPFGRFKLAKSSSTEEDALNLSSAMWFAWGVLLNSGIGEGTPRSFSARVLGMVWAGFAMIIVASYTANLAAFLVLDRPEASISGIDDARLRNPQKEFKFATVRNSPVEQYFKRQVEYATMYRMMDMHNKDSADEAIELVKKGELKAFIWDSARISYEASRNCKLITAGEVFGRNGYGLAMKKGNPWLYEMSQAVLNFHERGFMEKLDTEWILVKAEGCDRTESSPATLGLTNMAGVFIMVAAGIVAGVFLIFIEIAYKKRRGLKEKELELAKNAVDRWRGNIEKRKILRKTLSNSESDFHRYLNNSTQSSCMPATTTTTMNRPHQMMSNLSGNTTTTQLLLGNNSSSNNMMPVNSSGAVTRRNNTQNMDMDMIPTDNNSIDNNHPSRYQYCSSPQTGNMIGNYSNTNTGGNGNYPNAPSTTAPLLMHHHSGRQGYQNSNNNNSNNNKETRIFFDNEIQV